MSSLPKHYITLDEYFELEVRAEYKSEYFAGEMYAMAGGTFEPSVLAVNLTAEMHLALRESTCTICNSDLRVKADDLYTYPDITIVCGPPQIGKGNTLLNPTLLVEVLSPSTALYDRTKKFECYRRIESLKFYVIVEQDRMHAEVYTRGENGWVLSEASGESSSIDIADLGIKVPLRSVYRNVHLPPAQPLHPALE